MSAPPSGRRLPVLAGAEHLAFRCNGCGSCCRALRVAITHHDLERLVAGTGRSAPSLIEWLGPDTVDMTGEPGTFVELREGRRLMVLAWRNAACQLLDAEQRCSAYAYRPHDCRLFPFNLSRDEQGRVTRIDRLPLEGCADERGAAADVDALARSDAQRWRELADYQARVARWNRMSRHRRRFRQPLGDAQEFLAFVRRPAILNPTDADGAQTGGGLLGEG